MNHEQLEALYGPAAKFSDHKTGETVRFTENGQEKQGTIIHVMAPGKTVGGIEHGVRYVVAAKERGFPSVIEPGAVLS